MGYLLESPNPGFSGTLLISSKLSISLPLHGILLFFRTLSLILHLHRLLNHFLPLGILSANLTILFILFILEFHLHLMIS